MWRYNTKKIRQGLLQKPHNSHLGTVRMESMERAYFWYPKMDEDM